ncbi:F0F1 ATP synthase subunit B [Candidatus Saccharibacteria bacterium]|nr:F0F1 ATP synthase subunit B [Candidatus Saccharibacteria bacterium]
MIYLPTQFAAEATDSSGGLGAFNINLKDFIFQLITFLIVLAVLRKWVIPKIVETMDKRQQTLEQSLANAKATEEALAKAEVRAEEILGRARKEADEALAETKKAAAGVIADAEAAAAGRAAIIIKEAEARLNEEREKLRQELRQELAVLVADATQKVIEEKLDAKKDMSLIERAIKGIAG